jgi:hypothetical protein
MVKRTLTILTTLLLTSVAGVSAAELKVDIPNIKLSGGISATGFNESKANNDGSSTNDIKLTDTVIELSGGDDFGGFDIAPLIVILALEFLQILINNIIMSL